MKSIVFRLGVLFHRRFCGLPILPGAETPSRARSDLHEKSKKALSTFVLRLPIVRRFHVAKGRSNAEKGENGKGRQEGGGRGEEREGKKQNAPFSALVSTVTRSSCTTETLQRQARLSLLADNLSNCYRFLCAVGYFCLGGPQRIFHLSYVREGCYQVENLLLRG